MICRVENFVRTKNIEASQIGKVLIMINLRKSEARGHLNFGWLDTFHTFSFGEYYDPNHMGFRELRVINEDRVAPGKGFGTHPHRDMEIVTYVLQGALEHKDSMGNGSVIRPGDVQRMSAGTGVTHSEFNSSPTEEVHLLQIWILPQKAGLTPSYEQKNFPNSSKEGVLKLIASEDGREGSVRLHQDVSLYASILKAGKTLDYSLHSKRFAWIQMIRGELEIGEFVLKAGDGASVENEEKIVLKAKQDSEILLFDLP